MSFFQSAPKPEESKSKMILRLEPPYNSSGDCGYRAVILGLLYFAEHAKENKDNPKFKSPLDHAALGDILKSMPIVQQILKSNPTASNAEILRSMLDKLPPSELYNDITLQLRAMTLESKWLDTQIIESLKTGLWVNTDASAYHALPAIKALTKKQETAMSRISFMRDTPIKDEDIDSIRQESWAMVYNKMMKPEEQKDLVSAIKKQMYGKDVWVDALFLQELTADILGSKNILFDYKLENTKVVIGPGTNESHFYINVPDNEAAQQLVKKGLCSLDARLSQDSKSENSPEKLQQRIDEFKKCLEYFNQHFGWKEGIDLYSITPGKSLRSWES